MDPNVTTVLALYGAVLSTVAIVRQWIQDRRGLTIFLDHVAFYERVDLVVVNSGRRPVTLVSLEIGLNGESVPEGAMFAAGADTPFPVTLGDGEPVVLHLGATASEDLLEIGLRPRRLAVYDAEGKAHTEYRARLYNPKYGYYVWHGRKSRLPLPLEKWALLHRRLSRFVKRRKL